MKQENKVFQETRPLLQEKFGNELAARVMQEATRQYAKLCAENPKEPKKIKAQTYGNIYPCISLYRALLQMEISKQQAVDFLDWNYSYRAKQKAQKMQKLFQVPGLYKLYPAMFAKVAKTTFGTEAGFQAKFYDMPKGHVKFDMIKCLYCDICKRENCFELVPCFCHTDDVNNANLHPKLCWNRTTIMGDGADKCDFDLFIRKK